MGVSKYRIFEIMSQPPHLTPDKITVGVKGHKSIKQAVWITHDKDVYTEKQVLKIHQRLISDHASWFNQDLDDASKERGIKPLDGETLDQYVARLLPNVGDVKPLHYHCYIVCNPAQSIDTIASWFDTARQNVEVKKGAGAFVDCIEYAVHDTDNAKAEGKYPYPWEDLSTHGLSLIEAQEMVNQKRIRRVKYGKDLNPAEALRMQVLCEGLSLKQANLQYPLLYAADVSTLQKLRLSYLADRAPLPATRINFYLCGAGGVGKDTMSKGIARQLFPGLPDDEIFHEIDDLETPFEGYDGQPVLIWSDARAVDFISTFGRPKTFKIFDLTPSRGRMNVKYGSVVLNNSINIVNGIDTYLEFLDGIAGEYTDKSGVHHKVEDKNQSYRRFPVIVPIDTDAFSILLNSGYLQDSANFQEYQAYKRISGNLARLVWDPRVRKLPKDKAAYMVKEFEQKMCGMFPGVVSALNSGLIESFSDGFENLTDELLEVADEDEQARIEAELHALRDSVGQDTEFPVPNNLFADPEIHTPK